MTISAKREVKVELKSSFDDSGVRDARRKLKQEQREQARVAKQAARDAKQQHKELLGAGRGFVGSVRSGLGMAAGIGLGLEAAGGIAGVVDGVIDYQKALTRLQITATATPTVMREFSHTVDQASSDTGIHRNEILSAAAAYVALTGDMDTARASTGQWAKIAQATGSTVSDIAQTAAALSQQMGIGPAEMEATFSALAQQGKAGAIELKDLAGVMSQIAPMWGQFKGGKGIEGVRQLGAALQIVKRGFGGDAGETVTGLQGLLVSLQKNAGRFKSAGIKVFDVDKSGKETMRDVFSIIDDISKSSLVKHPDLMEKAFGRVEAYRAYLQLVENRDELHKFVEDSRDAGLIQRDFNTYMESASGRMEKAWNDVRLAIAGMLTPERIEQMVGGIERMTDAMGPLSTAVGKIVDGFSEFLDMVAKAKSSVTGGDHYKYSDEETDAIIRGRYSSDPKDKASADRIVAHKQAYDKAIDDILGSETPFGSTEASLFKAYKYNIDPFPTNESVARADAARQYLQARDKEITPARRKRLREEAEVELEKDMSPAQLTTYRYNALRDQDQRSAEQNRLFIQQNIKPLVQPIADAITQGLRNFAPHVEIGSESLVNGTTNAPKLRNRPGGRP